MLNFFFIHRYYLAIPDIGVGQLHLYSAQTSQSSNPICLSCPKAQESVPITVHKTHKAQVDSFAQEEDTQTTTTTTEKPQPNKKNKKAEKRKKNNILIN